MACLCHAAGAHRLHFDGASMPFAEPGVQPNYGPSRAVRITHADLTLTIDPRKHTFTGSMTFTVSPLPGYAGTVRFDFADARVTSVQSGDASLAFTHDDDVLAIAVDHPERITVTWEGTRPRAGLYFTGPTEQEPERQHMAWTQCQDEDGHFIFPCHDHPGTKHPWTITLVGPEGYTLLSNGEKVAEGERAVDGTPCVFATYEQREPMPAYLLTAVVARLTRIDTTWRDRTVGYLVPEGSEAHVARAMGKTPLMLEHFSQITGVDYPWPRYDQVVVHDFIFGGMENIACTTMTDLLLVDEKAVEGWDPDGLVAHELAHQWFGDLVTCQDWSQAWLNESWATYMEAVWWEHDRDADEATWYRWTTAQEYLEEDGGRYRRPIVSYDFREPIDVFDRHLYQKGGTVLHTLRCELGDDAFWAGVKHYLDRHRFQTAHTRHFQRALEEASGRNLDAFFAQWVHQAGHPALKVTLAEESGLLLVTVQQTQDHADTPKAHHFTLRLEVLTEEGAQTLDLPVRERERTWAVPVSGAIRTVRVDPGFRLLSTLKLEAPRAWLQALSSDPCPVLALRAARAMLASGAPPALDTVRAMLAEHAFWGVRGAVASLLAKHGGEEAEAALVARLAVETDSRAASAIGGALGAFRSEKAADALLAVLATEPESWHVHGAALNSLGRTQDARARAAITPFLNMDSWGELIRQRALLGLAQTEDAAALPILAEWCASSHDRLSGAALQAVAKLGNRVPEVRQQAVDILLERVKKVGFRAQLSAIAGLGQLADPRSAGLLSQIHETAADGRTRRMAYEALVKVRAGRTGEEALQGIRAELRALAEENRKLRKRIERLERAQASSEE